MSELVHKNHKHIQFAIVLAWATLVYNILEGVISMYFGFEERSIALAGFGADSFVEAGSAIVILWRLWNIDASAVALKPTFPKICLKLQSVMISIVLSSNLLD